MTAYYNEIDPQKVAWLRELIKAGAIADGIVDERSIEDIRPSELVGFTQCNFFAGIGVWSYALRCAGWPDDRPVWTGSCPCQSFSTAGKRKGFADERHLFPSWFHLISVCRPPTIFGEQVASKDGLAWLDLVHADLEGQGYAVGCLDLCAAGFGAPHIRQRLYFVAESREFGRGGWGDGDQAGMRGTLQIEGRGPFGELAGASGGSSQRDTRSVFGKKEEGRSQGEQHGDLFVGHSDGSPTDILADAHGGNSEAEGLQRSGEHGQQPENRGPCNGFWRNAVWLLCRDGKARPVGVECVGNSEVGGCEGDRLQSLRRERDSGQQEPHASGSSPIGGKPEQGPAQSIIFPLADGTAKGVVHSGDPGSSFDSNGPAEARVLRLRGYGDAIVAPIAIEFIKAYMDSNRINGG